MMTMLANVISNCACKLRHRFGVTQTIALLAGLAFSASSFADDNLSILQAVASKIEAARKNNDIAAERKAYRDALDQLEADDPTPSPSGNRLRQQLYLALAEADVRAGRLQDAIADDSRAISYAQSANDLPLQIVGQSSLSSVYFQLKDCQHALEASDAAWKLIGSSPRYQYNKLITVITAAKCHVQQGMNDKARDEFETAWDLADHQNYILPDTIDDLQTQSVKLYHAMHWDGLADTAIEHAERLRAKNQAPIPTATARPRFTQVTPPVPVPVSTAKPGFADLNTCKPNYPAGALARGEQGTVKVTFNIDKGGNVAGTQIRQSSGSPQLDQATVDALSTCKFRAGVVDGKPVDGSFDVVYVWKLQ